MPRPASPQTRRDLGLRRRPGRLNFGLPFETFYLFVNPSAAPITVRGLLLPRGRYGNDRTTSRFPPTRATRSTGRSVPGMSNQAFAAFFQGQSGAAVHGRARRVLGRRPLRRSREHGRALHRHAGERAAALPGADDDGRDAGEGPTTGGTDVLINGANFSQGADRSASAARQLRSVVVLDANRTIVRDATASGGHRQRRGPERRREQSSSPVPSATTPWRLPHRPHRQGFRRIRRLRATRTRRSIPRTCSASSLRSRPSAGRPHRLLPRVRREPQLPVRGGSATARSAARAGV